MTAENGPLWQISTEADKVCAEIAKLELEKATLLKVAQCVEELEEKNVFLEKIHMKGRQENSEFHLELQRVTALIKEERTNAELKHSALESELACLCSKQNDLTREKASLETELQMERNRRAAGEQETTQMREQLLSNANLLASPALSRVGSARISQRDRFDRKKSSSQQLLISGPDGKTLSVGNGTNEIAEVALILRQQQLINELRTKFEQSARENDRLKAIMDGNMMIENLDKRTAVRTFDAQRLQELEVAYTKLKEDLDRLLNEKIKSGCEAMNFKSFVDKVINENDRRREESVELRAVLASRFERHACTSTSLQADSGHWSVGHSDDECGSMSDIDEEIGQERQFRQLKVYVQTLIRTIVERNTEIERLENRLNELAPIKDASDESRPTEENFANIHQKLTHLEYENLNLQNKLNRQTEELGEARAQLRGYKRRVNYSLDNTSDAEIIRLETLRKDDVMHSSLLEVFNVPEFTRILVYDLKPRLARLLTPCIPSYLLLAAFRHYDHAKDEAGVTGLFTLVHMVLKDVISRTSDMDALALWLVNSWRLLNLFRQYSGESNHEWNSCNTGNQNVQRMHMFDLTPLRDQLRARVEECYQNFLKRAIEPILSPKIVPGILQDESSHGMVTTTTTIDGDPKRHLSIKQKCPQRALDDLIELLNFIHTKLKVYGADPVLLSQVFGQMTYWICALALNHLMFRKELCNFEKAIQIKHNVTEVQSWLSAKNLGAHRETLEPLVQASHLLQSKKDDSNLDTLCGEMTSTLKPKQVIAILQHYSPSDGFEERRLDSEFLIKVSERLNARTRANGGTEEDINTLIMMDTYLTPFNSEPFVYSDFKLETLSLPTCLHLHTVCRLL